MNGLDRCVPQDRDECADWIVSALRRSRAHPEDRLLDQRVHGLIRLREFLARHEREETAVIEHSVSAGVVRVRIGEVELWLSPEQAEEWAKGLLEDAADARAMGAN